MKQASDKWKLSSGGVIAIVTQGIPSDEKFRHVSLVIPENPKTIDKCTHKLNTRGYFDTVELSIMDSVDKFQLKIYKGKLLIKNPEFPFPDNWYLLENFLETSDVMDINDELNFFISHSTLRSGEFEEKFEPIFSQAYPEDVSFTAPHLPNHETFKNEALRQLNVSICKKTTKWKPGYRYDTKDRTYYYLGDVYTRFTDFSKKTETVDLGDSPKEVVKLYIDDIHVGKTIPLINNKIFTAFPLYLNNEDILDINEVDNTLKDSKYIIAPLHGKKPSAVEVGDFSSSFSNPLPKSLEEVEKFRKDIFDTTLEIFCTRSKRLIDGRQTISYYNCGFLLEQFFYVFPTEIENKKTLKEIFTPFIDEFKEVLYGCFLLHANKQTDFLDISFRKENIRKLVNNVIFYSTPSIFVSRREVVTEFLKRVGIDLEKEAEYWVEKIYDPRAYMSSFEKYLENEDYLLYNGGRQSYNFRDKSTDCSYERGVKPNELTKTFFPTTLSTILIEMISGALDKNGCGVSRFGIYHSGNKKLDDYYVITITLEDIYMKFQKTGREMSLDLISDIISSKFWNVTLKFDKSLDIFEFCRK